MNLDLSSAKLISYQPVLRCTYDRKHGSFAHQDSALQFWTSRGDNVKCRHQQVQATKLREIKQVLSNFSWLLVSCSVIQKEMIISLSTLTFSHWGYVLWRFHSGKCTIT